MATSNKEKREQALKEVTPEQARVEIERRKANKGLPKGDPARVQVSVPLLLALTGSDLREIASRA